MQQADLRERKARIGPQRTASGREPQYITCADRLCASARASGETKTRRPPVRRQADKAQNYVIQKTGHVYTLNRAREGEIANLDFGRFVYF